MKFNRNLTEVELNDKIIRLKEWYTPINLNPAFHRHKMQSVRKLNYILERASRAALHGAKFDEILLCALTIIYYFSMRLKLSTLNSEYFSRWCSKRQFLKAETVFQKTMDRLLPERSEATITVMLTFFTDVALWPFESFVCQILDLVLYFTKKKILVLNMLLTDIHCALFYDVSGARHRVRVLYDLLKSEYLVLEKPKLIPFIVRLLDYYSNGIIGSDNKLVAYSYLQKGFEVCVRRIFERVPNRRRVAIIKTMLDWFSSVDIEDDNILELSSLVQYAADVYEVGPLVNSLPEDLINRVLSTFVGSRNPLRSLIGSNLIQHFLDRQHNAQYLVEPKLYSEYVTETPLKIGKYSKRDKEFIRRHREKLHEYFIFAMTKHCVNRNNLKAVYTVVCCMVLEVPCGLTAATAAYMMMVVQDFALNEQNISLTCRLWMHAIVISVMSLICWVHKTPVLYMYVNQIMTRRAKEAPQLNPPLLQNYHVRSLNSCNDPSLFFEDWELRYGLWKAFSVPPGTDVTPNFSKKNIRIFLINKSSSL